MKAQSIASLRTAQPRSTNTISTEIFRELTEVETNVRAAIKLQLRDVDSFIHADFRQREDLRYVKKTLDTKMSKDDFKVLVAHIKSKGCIPSATPFDEASVDFAVELGLPFLKIASSDINDWVLIEKIASTRLPVAVSSGGSSLKDLDDLVHFFKKRDILLALNHCVSLYPSEDSQLELNQIDFLRDRYPGIVIGLSTHEYHDWSSSVMMAYAKGARTFERHIDIEADGIPVAPYCTLPEQADEWFRAFHKAVEMCGRSGSLRLSRWTIIEPLSIAPAIPKRSARHLRNGISVMSINATPTELTHSPC